MQMRHMEISGAEHERSEGGAATWTFYGAADSTTPVQAAASAKTGRRAARTYTNQDIDQVNQKTGTVKYDGKTETIK